MPTTRQVLTIGSLSVLTAGISYCFYFDYKRRNDPAFRKKLLKEQRKLSKQKQTSNKNASREAEEMLAAAVAAVNAEPLPTTIEGKENYFMEQVGMGEMLAGRLPQGAVPAAISFFKAYKVYPSPQELMMIYQRTMPPEVFGIVVEMIKLDVNQTIRSSQASSSGASRRSAPSGEALIEEITGEEAAASKPASQTSSNKPDSKISTNTVSDKPTSTEQSSSEKPEVPQNPPSTLSAPASEAASFKSAGEQPQPRSESPKSAPLSEHGSGAGESQTANSYILVDDSTPVEPVAPVEKSTGNEEWVDDHDEKVEPSSEEDPKVEELTPATIEPAQSIETAVEEENSASSDSPEVTQLDETKETSEEALA
ncbi:mitochondrial import receptor subunit [Melampsora larici-populina 98AG31]|uniref:Mitochondrial import receptor subunit n=1 Tax=Melampsora larici-populina (strain 98AG31 / pathotype 3-4-7) TaxID=747676 RepID=F4R317_MELLP|nr:mitochondrial import receptor subunit [Melampsora larici-populina 98AG31]EGG12551.1 mitochondrial import receptor subunit [Melampsora larici-populina 98AG31]